MRSLAVLALALGACASDATDEWASKRTLPFGPFTIEPAQEINGKCVQITLHNKDSIDINQVELTTGPGFHHSNWFFVPEFTFAGEDGVYKCSDRDFNEPIAALQGGVLFAQSTQSKHEIQQFSPGVAVRIPPHSKIVSQVHLLNSSDATITVKPTIALTPIRDATTLLAGISFQDHALGLPPNKQSRFTVECDLLPQWTTLYNNGVVSSAMPDFKVYYGLAHYHELGTQLQVEAVKPTGESATVFTTATKVGDTLGGPLDPLFDMTGYTRLRLSCDYFNNTDAEVKWGVGNQEMCVFLAFSDSAYNWGGGILNSDPPGTPVDVNGVATFEKPVSHCQVFATERNGY